MKTLILLILILTIVFISNAQNVSIPDTAFLYALIDEGVDTNGDSLISYAEAEAVTSLDVSGEWICEDTCWIVRSIESLVGIQAFVNLDTLNCCSNELTSLDVSNNPALTYLSCGGNELTSLDVSGCTALTYLSCRGNQLTSLDVSNNTALTYLSCGGNQLTTLDVSNCTALIKLDVSAYYGHYNWSGGTITTLDISNNILLKELSCGGNPLMNLDVSNNSALTSLYCVNIQITCLDVSNNIELRELYCYSNQLDSLDISSCTALKKLWCGPNQLTNLDVSKNNELEELVCGDNQLTTLDVSINTALTNLWCWRNQLTSLDLSKNISIISLDLGDMPSLHEVCVWTMPFPPVDLEVNTEGSPNVDFTTDCAITVLNAFKVNSTINIYPNPSDDIINIEIENISNAIIEIYNVSGTLILSKVLDSKVEKIDISDFPKGIYLVKVRQDDVIYVKRLVVR